MSGIAPAGVEPSAAWARSVDADLMVSVQCYNFDGQPSDEEIRILVRQRGDACVRHVPSGGIAFLPADAHGFYGACGEGVRERGRRDNPADPYITVLGYFNALRELGGSRRIIELEFGPSCSCGCGA